MPSWIRACSIYDVDQEDVTRFDHNGRAFAIYHSPDGTFFATDGLCTHEQVHLSRAYCSGLGALGGSAAAPTYGVQATVAPHSPAWLC